MPQSVGLLVAIVHRLNGEYADTTTTGSGRRRLGVYHVAIKRCDVRYHQMLPLLLLLLLLLLGFGCKSFSY